jgi:hypothetical protein
MKKALLGIAGLLILAFVIVLFVNARKEDPAKKPGTETVAAPSCCTPTTTTSEACGKNPSPDMKCEASKTEKTAAMAGCTGMAKEKTTEAKACEATCPMHAK